MSAFIVTTETVATVAMWILDAAASLDEIQWTAAMLMKQNHLSVCYRYAHIPEEASQPVPDVVVTHDMVDALRRMPAQRALGAVRCYAYQSCEDPGWDTSLAKRLVDMAERLAESRGVRANAWDILPSELDAWRA